MDVAWRLEGLKGFMWLDVFSFVYMVRRYLIEGVSGRLMTRYQLFFGNRRNVRVRQPLRAPMRGFF